MDWQLLGDEANDFYYHTPDLHSYDVKLGRVTGWDESRREVVLDKEVNDMKSSGTASYAR